MAFFLAFGSLAVLKYLLVGSFWASWLLDREVLVPGLLRGERVALARLRFELGGAVQELGVWERKLTLAQFSYGWLGDLEEDAGLHFFASLRDLRKDKLD